MSSLATETPWPTLREVGKKQILPACSGKIGGVHAATKSNLAQAPARLVLSGVVVWWTIEERRHDDENNPATATDSHSRHTHAHIRILAYRARLLLFGGGTRVEATRPLLPAKLLRRPGPSGKGPLVQIARTRYGSPTNTLEEDNPAPKPPHHPISTAKFTLSKSRLPIKFAKDAGAHHVLTRRSSR